MRLVLVQIALLLLGGIGFPKAAVGDGGDLGSWRDWASRIADASNSGELAALAVAGSGVEEGGLKNRIGALLAARWCEVDPAAAVAWAEGAWQRRESGLPPFSAMAVLTGWALVDEAAALDHLEMTVPDIKQRSFNLLAIAFRASGRDPDLALRWLQRSRRLPGGRLGIGWERLAEANPVAFVDALIPAAAEAGANEVRDISRIIAKAAPEELPRWFEALPEGARKSARLAVLKYWGRYEPRRAMVEVSKWPDYEVDGVYSEIALSGEFDSHLAAAKWLASKLSFGKERAFRELARRQFAETDATVAERFAFLQELGQLDDAGRGLLLASVADEVPSEDFGIDLLWLVNTEDIGEKINNRLFAIAGLTNEWYRRDPIALMGAVFSEDLKLSDEDRVWHGMREFDLSELGGAEGELLRAIPPRHRAAAVVEVLDGLDPRRGYLDPAVFAGVLVDGPATPVRAKAFEDLADLWQVRDPQRALEWAVGLGDEVLRDPFVRRVGEGWGRRDRVALTRYTLGLPEGAARDLLCGVLLTVWDTEFEATELERLYKAERSLVLERVAEILENR